MPFRLVTLLCCLVLSVPSPAAEVTYYEYPFVDPLEATVIGTPEIYRADLPDDIPVEVRQVQPFPHRPVPEIFWYWKTLRFAFSAQPGAAPLAFIIPGTGAGFESSKSVILQRILYAAGLHVVSLPSPIHPNFIVSASASERPGLLADDARDLYRVMTLIRRQLQDEIQITGYDLAGYSLGATFAPNWMDWPMFFHNNPERIAPGMVLFLHMILMDSDAGLAMTLGRTSLITERGPEPLSARPLDLIVR